MCEECSEALARIWFPDTGTYSEQTFHLSLLEAECIITATEAGP